MRKNQEDTFVCIKKNITLVFADLDLIEDEDDDIMINGTGDFVNIEPGNILYVVSTDKGKKDGCTILYDGSNHYCDIFKELNYKTCKSV